MERQTKKILGYDVDLFDFDQAIDYVVKMSDTQSTQTITLNPEMIELGEKNPEFSEILKKADLIIPDGFGVKLALKIYGISQERIPGIEFAGRLVEHCAKNSLPVALIGAKEETVQVAALKLKEKNEGLNVVYVRNGYFSEQEERAVVDEIKSKNPKLVLVALGVPKQEIFIKKYKNEFSNTIFVGVGGSFDVWSGNVKRAPKVFRQLGLEWFWRLIKEPSRFKRMFPTLPLFLFKVIINRK